MEINEIPADEYKESATRGLNNMHDKGEITTEERDSAVNWLDSPENTDTITLSIEEL